MKAAASIVALVAGLSLASSGWAQDPPVGGPDAKGNAPVKRMHTVNDGSARRGANSFTEKEARKHIMNSGYSDVTGLTKGRDGVWRGTATKDGAPRPIALDFKGNVTEGAGGSGGMGSPPTPAAPPAGASGAAAGRSAAGASRASGERTGSEASGAMGSDHAMAAEAGGHGHHRHHHGGRGHHHASTRHTACANPGPNGAACSGQDRNRNGISDREDRAIRNGAHP